MKSSLKKESTMRKISSGMPNFSITPFRIRGLQTTQAHRQENLEIIKLEAKNGNHKVCINDVVYYYRTDNINSYNHNISEKNLLSYFKSTRHLIDFFEKYDTANTYRRAIDIGVVNAYRWARNAKISLAQVDISLNYIPHSRIIRLVIQLIKWGIPANCVNLLYLSYRRLLGTK